MRNPPCYGVNLTTLHILQDGGTFCLECMWPPRAKRYPVRLYGVLSSDISSLLYIWVWKSQNKTMVPEIHAQRQSKSLPRPAFSCQGHIYSKGKKGLLFRHEGGAGGALVPEIETGIPGSLMKILLFSVGVGLPDALSYWQPFN